MFRRVISSCFPNLLLLLQLRHYYYPGGFLVSFLLLLFLSLVDLIPHTPGLLLFRSIGNPIQSTVLAQASIATVAAAAHDKEDDDDQPSLSHYLVTRLAFCYVVVVPISLCTII